MGIRSDINNTTKSIAKAVFALETARDFPEVRSETDAIIEALDILGRIDKDEFLSSLLEMENALSDAEDMLE